MLKLVKEVQQLRRKRLLKFEAMWVDSQIVNKLYKRHGGGYWYEGYVYCNEKNLALWRSVESSSNLN